MFSFFKRNTMKTALDACQRHHKKNGYGQELSPDQYEIIISTQVFRDIDSRYKQKGLTHWGALAWLAAQTVEKTIKFMNESGKYSQASYDMSEKMANIAVLIGNNIPELKLSKADMGPIENANILALKWIEFTKTEDDELF